MTMYSDSQSQNQYSQRHYPAQQEDMYAEDTERLYDSFNDLYEDFDDGRSKTPFVIIGALLALAIVGGGLAFAYKRGFQGTSTDSVPVIVADRDPAKVAPKDPGGMNIPHQDSLLFDQINGNSVDENTNIQSSQTPGNDAGNPPLTIGDLASQVTDTGASNQPITMGTAPTAQSETLLSPAGQQTAALPKPLLPPGVEAPAASATAPQANTPAVLSPRKVETFTITPDGRIVSQTVEVPQQQPVGANPGRLAVPSLPSVLESVDANNNVAQPQALTPTGTAQAETPSLPGGGVASLAPSPQPKPRPTTRDLAAVQQNQQLQQQQRAARPAATTSANEAAIAGKFAVQVASNQRQADSLAIFADLQRRYPNLVSGYRPLIQRADLGARGIFYRLRIGPLDSKSDATRLCGSLRNAGLPGCIVRGL